MRYDLYVYFESAAREPSWDDRVRRKYPWLEDDGWWLFGELQKSKSATRRWWDQVLCRLAEWRHRRSAIPFRPGQASKRTAT